MKIEGYYIDTEYTIGRKRSDHFIHQLALGGGDPTALSLDVWFPPDQNNLNHGYEIARDLAGFIKNWKTSGAKTYLMNGAFFRKLLKSEFQDTLGDMLPAQEWIGYVAFPEGQVSFPVGDDLFPIVGSYIRFLWADNGQPIIYSILVMDNVFPSGRKGFGTQVIPVDRALRNLDSLRVQLTHNRGIESAERYNSVLKALVLSVLYCTCGNPDLRQLLPSGQLSKSAEIGLRRKGINVEELYSDAAVPVELVSWGWLKDPQYTKDQWEVRAFFRAVAHGEGRSLRKTMWFPPNIAHRRKGRE